jgi:CheY-like chemotaxis protein
LQAFCPEQFRSLPIQPPLGNLVLTAASGTEALIEVAEKRSELRAVITDLHMPRMDGLAFVRLLKGKLPQAGIIVASGRLEEREENEFKSS